MSEFRNSHNVVPSRHEVAACSVAFGEGGALVTEQTKHVGSGVSQRQRSDSDGNFGRARVAARDERHTAGMSAQDV